MPDFRANSAAAPPQAVAVESYGLGIYRDLLTSRRPAHPGLNVDERGTRTDDLA